MSDQVQTVYDLYRDPGQVGSISRKNAPYDGDSVTIAAAGAGLEPGDAFKLNASGEAEKVDDLADSVNKEGIMSFEIGYINQNLAGGTNNIQGLSYSEGDSVKYWRQGYIYGIGGGTVARGAEIGFDPADNKWKAQAGTGMTAARAFEDGNVMEIQLRVNA